MSQEDGWVRLVLMVGPNGEFNAIGGEFNVTGDNGSVGAARIQKRIKDLEDKLAAYTSGFACTPGKCVCGADMM